MSYLFAALRNLWVDRRGVTAIEYAVLAGSIAVGVGVVFAGDSSVFTGLTSAITDAINETAADGS